jgi:hypothetical protein
MNSEITENVQTAIRPGSEVDTYYYGDTNSQKQAFSCIVNNKFRQVFTNLGAGTSQFTISPYQGVSDIILYLKMGSCASLDNAMLPQGWGYSMIRQVSVRYGSSAQYFFTGEQIYLQAMFDCEDSRKRDQLAALGGNALTAAQAAALVNPEAFVYLKLPHNSPRADGKPLPFPSDILVQPIIITVELYSIGDTTGNGVFKPQLSGGTPQAISGLPSSLSFAQLQVKQEMMSDSADLLARRVDMNTHGYTYPLKYFAQQEVQINVGAGGPSNSVNLTGFRAGEVRNIILWLTNSLGEQVDGPLVWQPLSDVELTYNGEIFYHNDSSSGLLWNLITADTTPDISTVVQNSSGAFATSIPSYWTDIPFAQCNLPYDKEVKLVHGKPILNAVVNLKFATPVIGGVTWTLHALYLYNASLLASRGSMEYIF